MKSYCQNLVPNSGFTLYTMCPISQNQLNRAVSWINPNTATPDYYHSCSGGIPNGLPLYYQQDHSIGGGGGFAAIGVFNTGPIDFPNREYAQVKLTDSLKQGSKYCIEFYASLTEGSGIGISDLGIYISDSAIYFNGPTNFLVIPQIENPTTNILTDLVNWILIKDIYTAHGGEQYITVGNFRDSASSHAIIVNSSNPQFSYYLIDDVSVINCDSLFIDVNEINLSAVVSIYPNPVKDEITIDFKGYALEDVRIRILDLMGKEETSYSAKWLSKTTLETDKLSSGLYIAEILSKNGFVVKKFLKV